jgi:sensor histidine kinase YesM
MLGTRAVLMPAPPTRGWWFAARVEYLTQLDWMFMTYLFLVGLAHALEFRRESDRHAVDSAQLEMRLVEAQLQALQRQLHPHFLFNTLNAIAGLMRTDVDAADQMMDRLGDLLRMTLNSSNVQEQPLKEELEMLQKYLDIEQARFGNRLTVEMQIDPQVLDADVPNLLLQPLVENAVRHGIAPYARPGHLSIAALREAERLTIRITDSGDGVPPHRLTLLNQGVGLANTRARLEHLYRGDHALVFSNMDGGFRVSVSIPFTVDRAIAEPLDRVQAGSVGSAQGKRFDRAQGKPDQVGAA